jgi:large subunit ribosomal protein L18
MKLLKKKSKEKFRLSIYKSHKHIYAQLINDYTKTTLVSLSTLQQKIKILFMPKKINAYFIGQIIGILSIKLHIINIIFDIKHQKYHGLIKLLAKGAKNSGLIF